jgi:multicomponent Na+:H+ antiporter subunit G
VTETNLLVETAVLILALGSVFFTLVATVGVLRLPDLYTRAHASSKADTLGAGFGLAAVAVAFGPSRAALKAGLLILFIYFTNPTAAHAISRAAYDQGVVPWTRDGGDENEGGGEG